MTAPNLAALDALIAAVEAGSANMPILAAFDRAGIHGAWKNHGYKAFSGSLDAALALHGALLPGWWWDVTVDYAISTDPTGRREFVAGADNPARAWLLATLKAYRAQVAG
jgi:hypothetical protein